MIKAQLILLFFFCFYNMCLFAQKKYDLSYQSVTDGLSSEEMELIERRIGDKFVIPNNYTVNNIAYTAEQVLDDKIYFNSIWEPVQIYDSIDWTINPFSDNSWLLAFHSLTLVPHLVQGYEHSGDRKYLTKAVEIVKDWLEFFPINRELDPKRFRYVWTEHSVANRLENFLYLAVFLKKTDFKDQNVLTLLYKSIYEHADWLHNPDNYVEYNHGIIMDMALLKTSLICPFLSKSKEWYDKSIGRIAERYEHDIGFDGVHLENSPAYHIVVTNWLDDIISLIKSYGMDVPNKLYSKLELMKEYMVYVLKPNGKLPLVGDTKDGPIPIPLSFKKDKNIQFVISSGREGKAPHSNSKIFPGAGIAIFRDNWFKHNEFSNSSYLYFISGFPSRVHKHADDLSFIFYSLGQDILIDPGLYTYTPTPERAYLKSSFAHNGFAINGKSYPMYNFNVGKTKMREYKLGDEYDYVKGETLTFKNISIKRELIYLKPNVIVLYDSITKISPADDVISVQQIFNLSDSAKIIMKSRNYVEAVIGDIKLNVVQVGKADTLKYYFGSYNPLRGFMSHEINELIEHPQLEFEKTGESVSFTTYIILQNDKYNSPITSIDLAFIEDKRIITYMKNEVKCTINVDEIKGSEIAPEK